MKVFVSWSKEPAKSIAQELRHMLGAFVPTCDPWMSHHDLTPGLRWNSQLAEQLATAKIALVCVTEENKGEPWLHFEAGSISNALGGAFVHPILFNVDVGDIPGTLTQFQVTQFTEQSFFALLRTLNRLRIQPEPEHDLKARFDRLWEGFAKSIEAALESARSIARPPVKNASATLDDRSVSLEGVLPAQPPRTKEKRSKDSATSFAHLLNLPGSAEAMIIEYLAERDDESHTKAVIAESIKINKGRVQHFLDEMVARDLVKAESWGGVPASYRLTPAGRAYAISEGYI
jgi:TIR domain